MMNPNRKVRGRVNVLYDEPELPNERFVLKIYGELESTREWSNVPSQLQYFRQGGAGGGGGASIIISGWK